ncbi:PfkB family carbohydrate kinase [Microbacterium sp.]|uniref:PfkB family carbohydrate kinase n=1 Tax=Microbacterium sp. TaxID=51671 RepID=UPI003A912731
MPDAEIHPVVVVGEGLVVFVPESDGPLADAAVFRRSLAGAELNVAVALSRADVPAAVISRVGDDGFGQFATAELRRHGVGTEAIQVDPEAPTGLYVKELVTDPGGAISRMHYYRSSSAGSRLSPATLQQPAAAALLQAARVVHTTGVTSALSATCLDAQRALFADVLPERLRSFSAHWRSALWRGREDEGRRVLAELARSADVLFVDVDDAAEIFGIRDAAELRLAVPEPRMLVITRSDGATAFDGAERGEAPSIDFTLVEPTGAADAFAAGFLAGFVSGLSLAGSLARANRLATRVMSSTRDHLG